MKNIFNALINHFQVNASLADFIWVDLDKGQMNYEKPPVAFPAALIKIEIPRSENLNSQKQMVEAQVSIKLCFDFTGETSNITPALARANSLKYLDKKEAVYKALQGWSNGEFNTLARVNEYEEQRPDRYKVVVITFKTSYRDDTAAT